MKRLFFALVLAGAFTVLGGAVEAAAPGPFGPLEVGPYLLAPDETSMTVCWKTAAPSDGKVEYGRTVEYGKSIATPFAAVRQKVTVKGLPSGTEYHYRVVTPVGATGDFVFRTLPGSDQPMTFVADGDQCGERFYNRHLAAYADIHPNFVISTGDIAGAKAEHYDHILGFNRGVWAATPWYPVFGNHDALGDRQGRGAMREVFAIPDPPDPERQEPCLTYYSFDAGGCHFTIRGGTAVHPYGASKAEVAAQDKWYQADLAAARLKSRFVFALQHDANEKFDYGTTTPAGKFADILFWGGIHNYFRGQMGQLTLIQTSGSNSRLREVPNLPWIVTGKKCFDYVCVDVDKDKLRLRAYDLGDPKVTPKETGGECIDTYELKSRGAR
ncbi:MAG: metallophosphoesterase family protein [Planctomycetota bacterium]